jgi:predicted amidohydrolase
MTPVLGALAPNLEAHHAAIDRAAADGVDLLVFPELSLTGYHLRDLVPEVALRLDSPQVAELAARSERISLVVGFVEETPGFNFHNAALYLEGGEVQHVHRKVYLPTYGMFDEERYFGAGREARTFDTRHGRTGVLICEDVWHPSLPYVCACDGMQQLIVPANSPARGASLEQPASARSYDHMLCTYAELFQCYVCFCNRVGCEEGVTFWGGSRVVAPDGAVVAQAPLLDPAELTVEMDPGLVRRERARTQLLSDERIELTLRELQRIRRTRHSL